MTKKKFRLFNIVLATLYLLTIAAFFYFLIKGLPYYRLPLSERPFSELHEWYKPSGKIGHGLGILGTGMILLMLTYSIRKRVKFFSNWGNMKDILNLHIYLGITGPLFILLHTSFKFGGIVSVSFWAMAAVALSGFIGRYLYLKIPAQINERKEKAAEHTDFIESQNQKWEADLAETESKYGPIEPDHQSESLKTSRNSALFLFQILTKDLLNFFYLRKVSREYSHKHHLARTEYKKVQKALIARTKIHNQIKFLKQAEHLFHYWHVIHLPFAYIMMTILFIHVAIALLLGYVWIF